MKNIAVFISGSGSDLQSVIDACERGQVNGKVVCVVANQAGAFGLERAMKHGIETAVFSLKNYERNAVARDRAIAEYLEPKRIDLIVLAGYLSIVTPELIARYRGKMINIHPSLIPAYCGKGMYGLRVHEAVLGGGEKKTGATVHYVDEGTDTGEIIRQVEVPVREGDTPQTLQARVLEQEHILLPAVVAELCKSK